MINDIAKIAIAIFATAILIKLYSVFSDANKFKDLNDKIKAQNEKIMKYEEQESKFIKKIEEYQEQNEKSERQHNEIKKKNPSSCIIDTDRIRLLRDASTY